MLSGPTIFLAVALTIWAAICLNDWLRERRQARRRSPIVGAIWRWDYLDVLTEKEALYWDFHVLPWGWSIISDQRMWADLLAQVRETERGA